VRASMRWYRHEGIVTRLELGGTVYEVERSMAYHDDDASAVGWAGGGGGAAGRRTSTTMTGDLGYLISSNRVQLRDAAPLSTCGMTE
jgi:hypothetical protein